MLYLINQRPPRRTVQAAVDRTDIMYVGGGNTLRMMRAWCRFGLDTMQAARRCYIQDYQGGAFGNGAIVFDALAGSRQAYTVRTAFCRTRPATAGPSRVTAAPRVHWGCPRP